MVETGKAAKLSQRAPPVIRTGSRIFCASRCGFRVATAGGGGGELRLGGRVADPPLLPGIHPCRQIRNDSHPGQGKGAEGGAERLQDEENQALQKEPGTQVIQAESSSHFPVKKDGAHRLEGVDRRNRQGGRESQVPAQGQEHLTKKNTRPNAGPEAERESQGNRLRGEKDRGDNQMVDLGEKTQAPGKSVGDGQNQTGKAIRSEPGKEKAQESEFKKEGGGWKTGSGRWKVEK